MFSRILGRRRRSSRSYWGVAAAVSTGSAVLSVFIAWIGHGPVAAEKAGSGSGNLPQNDRRPRIGKYMVNSFSRPFFNSTQSTELSNERIKIYTDQSTRS